MSQFDVSVSFCYQNKNQIKRHNDNFFPGMCNLQEREAVACC